MSNGLAIAAITAVFKNLLEDGLVQNSALSGMGNVLVTTLPPDQISIGVDGEPQLNLFLYQVAQNRNADLGGRDLKYQPHLIDGSTADKNPPLAIDLHYLLTAYGNKDFQTEMLLGYVMQLMHQTPVLSNDAIRAALNHVASTNRTGLLSQAIESTSVADLSEQLGQVQIAPNLFDTEQMSRLWSLLQSSYRPSIAYEVSMVFIGSKNSSLTSESIQRAPDQPRIDKIVPSSSPNGAIIAGSSLIIYGKNLCGDVTRLCLNGDKNLLEPQIVENNRILFNLPESIYAGHQRIQVFHQPKFKFLNSRQVVSNEKAFILHPTIRVFFEEKSSDIQEQNSPEDSEETTLTVQFSPSIGERQQVLLKLFLTNEKSDEVFTFDAPSRDSDVDTVKFLVQNIPSGNYLIKSQVDGVENLLDIDQVENRIMIQTQSLSSSSGDEEFSSMESQTLLQTDDSLNISDFMIRAESNCEVYEATSLDGQAIDGIDTEINQTPSLMTEMDGCASN